jgi:integrase
MAQRIDRLNALAVSRAKKPGLHADGGGLGLQVTASGAKSWILRFMLNGRPRSMGLGSLTAVGLSDARELAREARRLCANGVDPIEARNRRRAGDLLEAAKSKTFKDCATAYIDGHKASWQNAKHATQWTNTLSTYAYPILGAVPVQNIDAGMVTRVIEPIWTTKTETAMRLRGRIEAVLNWATASGYRQGENPARWRGHLENRLPSGATLRAVRHHAALPYDVVGEFIVVLRRQNGIAALALELAILTACRTGEVIGALWSEIDIENAVWIIPAGRMKGRKEHRVPLSSDALALLDKAHGLRDESVKETFVFTGRKKGKSLSNMAMLKLLKRMGRDDVTVHGFRSTFRDWCSEQTNYPREVAEMALAHTVGDKVEAAYRRGDLFEKRKRLMDAWAAFCAIGGTRDGIVTPIREHIE